MSDMVVLSATSRRGNMREVVLGTSAAPGARQLAADKMVRGNAASIKIVAANGI